MQESIDPFDVDLEQALSQLKPALPLASVRDLWYRAGYTAGRRQVTAWRASTAASLLLACGLLAYPRAMSIPTLNPVASSRHRSSMTPPTMVENVGHPFDDSLLDNDPFAMRLRAGENRFTSIRSQPLNAEFDGLPAAMLHQLDNTRG